MSVRILQSSETFKEALNILNDLNVHSGSDLGKHLGISRTAVWKITKKLEKYGVKFNSDSKGYQLKDPLVLLDEKKIRAHTSSQDYSIEIYESLGSTNDHLLISNLPPVPPHFCFAEFQEKGRGRLGRQWHSPFGANVVFSLSRVFDRDMGDLSGLSLVIGICIIEALKDSGIEADLKLKWPNDVYLNGVKVEGNLIDVRAEANGHCQAIIGVGLNVNMLPEKGISIDQEWTSLAYALDQKFERNILAANLIDVLLRNLTLFNEKGFNVFFDRWQSLDFLEGKDVALMQLTQKKEGRVLGVDNRGYLLIEDKEGSTQSYSSGEAILLKG
ncbi:uncharacterized protein LOC111319834 [Stylophora pistillata]|uniref:uncharacterized protein LOC111319834 n=1 Tax=Stylophora pistillata TaxID=50429 RepID=UPI000C043639|nr:uncharacterized protein LOC111319834 [Stylophora pistillata]